MKILLFTCLFACIFSFSLDKIIASVQSDFDYISSNVKCYLTYQDNPQKKLRENLEKHLILHEEAKQTLIRRISYYLSIKDPTGILKISIYGLSKTGKTFTSELIIQSIFKQNSPGYIVYHLPSKYISKQELKQLLENSLHNRLRLCHEVLILVVDDLYTRYADLPEMISINNDGTKIIILFLYTISDIKYNKIINNEKSKYNYILYHPYYSKDVRNILIHEWNEYLLSQINKNNLIDITIDKSFFEYIARPTTKLIEYYQDQYSQNIFEIYPKMSESINQICNCLLKDLLIDYAIFSKIQIYYENEFLAKIYDNINNVQKVMKAKEPIENILSNILSKGGISCNVFYL